MQLRLVLLACVASLGMNRPLGSQALAPQRTVAGSQVISLADPAAQIHLPDAARYVGAHRWTLFGVADCEIHVFVEADSLRRVQRYYYVQFEQYLPSHPTYAYDYASRKLPEVTKDGFLFYLRPNFGSAADPSRPGSEQEAVYRLIASAGYTLPPHFANVRLVSVLDSARRKELLIYYVEDLAPTGFTSRTLIKDEANRVLVPEWNGIAEGVTQRALERIRIVRQ